MAKHRKPRHFQAFNRACHGFLLCLATLFLVACQFAIPPQGTPAPAAAVADDSLTSTEVSPEPTQNHVPSSAGLIQLVDPLDEPEFYCVDVPGFGRSLNLQGALTAHTCKPGADDEMFQWDSPVKGQISMPAYNLCMEANGDEAGTTLGLAECSDAPLQFFRYEENGRIRLEHSTADGELCLTVGPEPGQPTGGPSHLRRTLTLETCSQVDESRVLWTVGSPNVVTGEP